MTPFRGEMVKKVTFYYFSKRAKFISNFYKKHGFFIKMTKKRIWSDFAPTPFLGPFSGSQTLELFR